MREFILTALLTLCVAMSSSRTSAATPTPADTVLFNGKIFTAESSGFVQALAIQGDRIEA
jgi:hypothetical protein